MEVEDLTIQDDPKTKKKYMFLSKFVSLIKGDHDFALKLALNVLANAVQASRTNQDDTSKEMLTVIKSQLEFMRVQFKAAQSVERETGKLVYSLRENINRITRQICDWETPQRSKRTIAELEDHFNMSPSKRNTPFTPPQNQLKEASTFGILAKPLGSPREKRNNLSENPASPRTPFYNRSTSSEMKKGGSETPEKIIKLYSSNNAVG